MSVLYIPGGSVTDAEISASAAIAATKVVQRMTGVHSQVAGADVAAKTDIIHIAKTAGNVVGVRVATLTAPTGGDKAFTVDVKKSTGGGAMGTILSAVVTINSSSVSLTTYSGTISTASYTIGDIFEVVVAVSGSTGSQAQGLGVEVFFEES